jgi:hypothetical protein
MLNSMDSERQRHLRLKAAAFGAQDWNPYKPDRQKGLQLLQRGKKYL